MPPHRPLPIALAAALLLAASPARAQQPTSSAARILARVAPGSAVRLEAPGIVVVDGRVVRATPDSLLVREASTSLGLALDEIVRLSVERDRALQGALMGAGMAFFVGASVGALNGYQRCGPGGSCAGGAVKDAGLYGGAGLAPGALAGWLLGRRARSWEQLVP